MKLIVVGVGPGDPDLITVKALKIISEAELLVLPRAKEDGISMAEQTFVEHSKNIKTMPIVFPMIDDVNKRDAALLAQLEKLSSVWGNAKVVVLPVIGDATLFATGSYLYTVWKNIVPDLRLELVSGVSAYSLAAVRSASFLAMGEDIFTVIPGTASHDRIQKALTVTNSAALYKPSALKHNLRHIVTSAGPWSKIFRVNRAGLSDERIIEGEEALNPVEEYMSVLLLWR